jgi:hypothetical protein
VSHIASQLPDKCIEYVKSGRCSQNGPQKQFGRNIKFIFQQPQPSYPCTGFLVDLGVTAGSEMLKDFSMKYDNISALVVTKESIKKNHSKKNGVGKYESIFCVLVFDIRNHSV